jgi:hypothetical protein
MGGEPWCFDHYAIAGLTDFQIHNVYVLPAVRRAKRAERDREMRRMTHDEVVAAREAPKDVRELGADPESVVAFYKEMGVSEATARAMVSEQWGE